MLAKIEFFEVYRVLWVLEFVDTDLEDHHLQIKYLPPKKTTERFTPQMMKAWA